MRDQEGLMRGGFTPFVIARFLPPVPANLVGGLEHLIRGVHRDYFKAVVKEHDGVDSASGQ